MSESRLDQRKKEYSNAVTRLKDALNQPVNEYLQDAAIQRFEFTYELAWKTLKLYLETKDIDVRNAKDTLKAAFEQGFIKNADDWTELHQKSNLTNHTYDAALAKEVYDFLKQKGIYLFSTLDDQFQRLSIKCMN